MKTPVETIRISKQGRDQLLKLRRQTGIEHWNVLCRWAFCVSLREKATPPLVHQKLEGGVEMTWKVFTGDRGDLYSALLHWRAQEDSMPFTPDGISTCLRLHIHRGLTYLTSGTDTKSIQDFVLRWTAPVTQD